MRRVLAADDDPVSLMRLKAALKHGGFTVVPAVDGNEVCTILGGEEAPAMAILDWEMPGPRGIELVRRVRAMCSVQTTYILMVTGRTDPADIAACLEAGANDYLAKPFARLELLARVNCGWRLLDLQERLAARVTDLEQALAEVGRLQSLLPVCAWCNKVRDGDDYWLQVDDYLRRRIGCRVTHAMCPDCLAREKGSTPELDWCESAVEFEAPLVSSHK